MCLPLSSALHSDRCETPTDRQALAAYGCTCGRAASHLIALDAATDRDADSELL
jgi:hypothetical protein